MQKHQRPTVATATDYVYADALRALAIFGIVVVHAAQYTQPALTVLHVDLARAVTYLSTIGVACLFVLSGFLLAPQFIAALLDESRPKPDTRRFLLKRFLRIYPLYVAAVLAFAAYDVVYGIVAMGHIPISPWDVAAHLLFLHDFSSASALSIDAPLWTMPVDVQFYLVLPLFFAALYAATRRLVPRRRAEALRYVLVAIVFGSILYRAIVVYVHPAGADRFVDQVIWLKNLFGMAAAFALGILVALEMQTTFAARAPRPRTGALAIAAGVALATGHALTRRNAEHAHSFGALAGFATYDAVAALAAAAILFGFAIGRFRASRSFLGGLRWQAAAALSYAVYLFHEPIVNVLAAFVHISPPNLAFAVQLAACTALLVPVAAVMHRYVELPFLRVKSRIRS